MIHFLFFIVGVVLCVVDFEKFPVHKSESLTPQYDYYRLHIKEEKYTMTGNLFVIYNPLKFYSVYPPAYSGCSGRVKTSNSSRYYDCEIASNAGFFVVGRHTDDYCIGNIVSNGKIIQFADESQHKFLQTEKGTNVFLESNSNPVSNFGVTDDGNFVIGFLEEEQVKSLEFLQLVSGVIWLVRNGTDYVDESAKVEHTHSGFINEAAPRNTIGHDKDGNLMILQLDGNERKDEGPGLHEVAKILIQHGAFNAINLDGGGSTTLLNNQSKIISNCTDVCPESEKKFHCPNNPDYCERSVTTINCIEKKIKS